VAQILAPDQIGEAVLQPPVQGGSLLHHVDARISRRPQLPREQVKGGSSACVQAALADEMLAPVRDPPSVLVVDREVEAGGERLRLLTSDAESLDMKRRLDVGHERGLDRLSLGKAI